MEIKKIPKTASQFWPAFLNKTLLMVIISQVLIALLLAGALVLFGAIKIDSPLLWIIVVGLLVISMSVNLAIFMFTIQPTKDLLSAIIHVSGEQPELRLSNHNTDTGP